jgi:type IV secretory pathway TrbD component
MPVGRFAPDPAEARMPILPVIDLLILMGWTSLFGAFALKGIYVSTSYRPALFGLGPMDMVIMAGVFLLFALALAARTWVKAHEGQALSSSARAAATLEAHSAMQSDENRVFANGSPAAGDQRDRDVADKGAEQQPRSVRA